mmetsp:Transcript_25108/g.38001  ORF Transcript_25108/g.38001 Transcript_25108/m.38001 type:complete len:112 (+) Transcript_25108:163-498(+)
MALRRRGLTRSAAAVASDGGKRIKRGRCILSSLRPSTILSIVLSLILLGLCAYLGFLIGDHIGENYNLLGEQVTPKAVVAVAVAVEHDEDYTELLKYPPPPQRRGIRSNHP